MKRLIIPAMMVLLLGATAVAACGKVPQGSRTPSTPTEVDMTASNFAISAITWKVNQPLNFVDPPSGALHVLCFGHSQTCMPNPNGPSALNASSGVTFNPGDSKSFTFTKPGTYEITCTIHVNMNVTVTVQ